MKLFGKFYEVFDSFEVEFGGIRIFNRHECNKIQQKTEFVCKVASKALIAVEIIFKNGQGS